MTIEMISEKAFSEGVHLTPDTIAERTRGLPFKAQFVLRGLMKLEKGTLAMTIPGGQTFILSGRTPGPQAAVTLHNWKLVHRAIGGGAIVGEGECRFVDLSPTGTLSGFLKYGYGTRLRHVATMNQFGRNAETFAGAIRWLSA